MDNYYDTVYYELLKNTDLHNNLVGLLNLARKLTNTPMAALAFPRTPHMLYAGQDIVGDIFFEQRNSLLPDKPYRENQVADTTQDPEHASNELCRGILQVRYFGSVPVTSRRSGLVAHLCVMSPLPGKEGEKDLADLEILAFQLANLWDAKLQIAFLNDLYDENRQAAEAQVAMEKQRTFYENILNSLPIDIAVFDAEHKYLFVNTGAISDKTLRDFIVGKDDFEYCRYRNRDIAVAEQRRAMFLDIKKTGKTIKWEDTVNNTAGDPVTHLRRFFPVYGKHNQLTMVIGFGMDITDRKKMEEQQTELLRQLTLKNTQLIDFCNIISHNLRAPLANIGLLFQLITESASQEEQKNLLELVHPVLNNVQLTLDELVESLQVRQNTDIVSDRNDMSSCLQKVLAGVQAQITKCNAVIEADFTDAPVVRFPARYMESVFLNFISNALKYQSPDRQLNLQIKTIKNQDDIILSFADNGQGIDLEKHGDKLFKIGKVFHNHPQAKGFGLFMTKSQVDAMNGEVWAESTPGVGSAFYVKFTGQNI